MNYYQCLKCFIFVVELKSFSGAARKLHCSSSAVSKQITWLEESVRATLLVRNTRNLTVTKVGMEIYHFAKRTFTEFALLRDNIYEAQHEISGRLNITAPVRVGTDLISPLLSEFIALHPKIYCKFHLDYKLMDLAEDEYDVAIRVTYRKHPNYLHKKINFPGFRLGVFASKTYLEKRGVPKVPEDLQEHNCITLFFGERLYQWEFKQGQQVAITGSCVTNNVQSMLDMARKGIGIIYLYRYQAEEYVKNGEMVEILEGYAKPPDPLYICYINQAPIPKRITAFIDYLTERISA